MRRGPHGLAEDLRSRSRTATQGDHAEHLAAAIGWRMARKRTSDPDGTWRQWATWMGFDTRGMNQKEARERYRSRIRNTLSYLERWHGITYEALKEPNGEGRCIVIHVPADVAPLFRATMTTVRRSRAGIFPISGEAAPPLKGSVDSGRTESKATSETRVRATSTHDRAASGTAVAAALAIAVEFGTFERGPTGVALLEARPDLATHPVEAVAREAWRLFNGAELPTGRGDCRLSPKRRRHLDRAAAQLERIGYRGLPPGPAASRAAAIDLALGDWADYWGDNRQVLTNTRPEGDPVAPPQTLGGLACCLHTLAREKVSGARNRKDPGRPARMAAWREARTAAWLAAKRAGADRV
jgi:hypothetical protein